MFHATRALAKSPGYVAIALVTLALGIGLNTSMFSAVSALLFRGAPFPRADRLIQIVGHTETGPRREFSEVELREIGERTTAFAAHAVIGRASFAVSEAGRPSERVAGVSVSGDLFATFGVQPMRGRAFTAEEMKPGGNDVVLLSHGMWRDRYGGADDIVGRTLGLDGQVVTVIGVMPPEFEYPQFWGAARLWRPLRFTPDQLTYRDYRAFELVGRLDSETTPDRAELELAAVAEAQERAHPDSYAGWRYRAVPLHRVNVDDLNRRMSWMLLGLSGFVLLIACANLAGLQLARATACVRALAVRAALGASRGRLVREQLTESIVLSLAGGALGLLVALWANRLLERELLVNGASGVFVTIDGAILGIAVAVSLATGVVFGVVPALFASRGDVLGALRSTSRGATTGRGLGALRQLLIVGQVALALVLLGGAGIMRRGFARFMERDSGWDTTRILTAALPISERHIPTDAERRAFFRALETRLASLPGVESAAIATSLPLTGYSAVRQILRDGDAPGARGLAAATHTMVTPGYFATMGIPLVEGRLFPSEIDAGSPRVILVNQSLARALWPSGSAIGQRLGGMDSGKPYWAEIIGVVRDVDAAAALGDAATPFQIYKPLVHEPWSFVNVVVRHPAPATMADALRRAISHVDPDLPPDRLGTVHQIVERRQQNLRLAATLLNGFAALGLVLSAIGLYAIVANLVARRTGEFGVRLAIGARPRGLLALVVGYGVRLTLVGMCLGIPGAYALGRYLGAQMPRLAGPDPLAIATASLVFMAVAILACWLPARRVTRTDPMLALRAE